MTCSDFIHVNDGMEKVQVFQLGVPPALGFCLDSSTGASHDMQFAGIM